MIRLSILLSLVIVTALLVWCISRWETWFHNPEEAPYTPAAVPERVLLTFGNDGELSRNISWRCGENVEHSFVELKDTSAAEIQKIKADGEVFKSRNGRAAYYVARLKELKEGHAYQYRVCTGNQFSDWYGFRLQSETDRGCSFLYIGDIQDTTGGIANELLRKACQKNPEAEFLVCGGDLTERPTDAYWGETFRGLDSIGQAMPIVTITGNHDYLKGIVGKLERRFSLIHSYFLDSMVDENQVFTIRYKDVQLFCLDSNRELPYLLTQRQWLEKQLQASNAKWKITVLHHPLHSIRGNTNNLIQSILFNDLIKEYGVDAVLQGHEHAYARMTNRTDHETATTPVYIISHCSPKNYRIEFNDLFDRFGTGSRYYQKMRTAGDTLFITAIDACTQVLYDSLFIVKSGKRIHLTDGSSGIPESLNFNPLKGNQKDAAFAKRIEEYKNRHQKRLQINP